jgi:transposase
MSRPKLLPADFMAYDFISLSKKESNGKNRVRLIAMAHIQANKRLTEIADALKVYWKTIQVWLANFRREGLAGLYVKTRKPKSRKLDISIEEWISEFLTKLNAEDTGGYLTGKQLHSLLEKEFTVKCSLRTIYNTLHRLKFSWITARSKHPMSDIEVQEAYKKIFHTC